MTELETDRLLLRRWLDADAGPMDAINADPEVTRYLGRLGDAKAFIARARRDWDEHGFGFWAVESRAPELAGELLGFVGVSYPAFLPQLAARTEIGWRLARRAWGRGYATEAAFAVRDHAFEVLGLEELISIIDPANVRSQRVAAKLGMRVAERVLNPGTATEVDVWQLGRGQPSRGAPDFRSA